MQEPDNKTYWQKVSKLYAPFMKSNSGLYKDICLRIRPYLSKDMNVLELAVLSPFTPGPAVGSHRLLRGHDRPGKKT